MRKFYPDSKIVGTTTGSENYYRSMRNAYKMIAPVSVNKFLLQHMLLNDGSTRIGLRSLKKNGYLNEEMESSENDSMVSMEKIVDVLTSEGTLQKDINSQFFAEERSVAQEADECEETLESYIVSGDEPSEKFIDPDKENVLQPSCMCFLLYVC